MIKNKKNKIVSKIYKLLKSCKNVSIFSHDNQDCDAYGSSLGLCLFLRSINIIFFIFYHK